MLGILTLGQVNLQIISSIVDWHRFDAYPDPDPTFHFDAAPDVGKSGIKI